MKKTNSRVGYPPRPWFIYPADLDQLWLLIPGCLFLCILKQGIAIAIFVALWWIISKSLDAQKSWENICDSNMELTYVSKEYIKNSGYVKVEGEYIYMTEDERRDILEYLEKKEKEEHKESDEIEKMLKDIAVELSFCRILDGLNDNNWFNDCRKKVAEKINGNETLKNLFDEACYRFEIDRTLKQYNETDRINYTENYSQFLFMCNFADRIWPYIVSCVYHDGHGSGFDLSIAKFMKDPIINSKDALKIQSDLRFDHLRKISKVDYDTGDILYHGESLKEYLNRRLDDYDFSKENFKKEAKKYYESRRLHW